jgi:MinD-like ATPase involved in chromosome partitioning or flagellar assembly
VLPYDPEVSKSINSGTPVLVEAPRAEISRRLSVGLRSMLPDSVRQRVIDLTDGGAPEGILSRLFRRDEKKVDAGRGSAP